MHGPARFTTGEFAALCGVSKHTLFHYDAVGVLSPAEKGENGYRYYTPAQIEVFHVIAALKELGMPLSQIRSYLDRRSPAELVALLEAEQDELTRRLRQLEQMRRFMAGRAELTRRAMACTPGVVTEQEQPRRCYVVTPAEGLADERDFAAVLARHTRYCARHGVVSPYPMASLLPAQATRRGEWGGYTHCCTRIPRPRKGLELFIAPAGRYLTLYHAGGFDCVQESYRHLLAEAARRELRLGEWFLEEVLLDELCVQGYEHYLLQLSILILPPERCPEGGHLV